MPTTTLSTITTNVEKLCHQVNARRREKHEILLNDHLVTLAVDRCRAQLSKILDVRRATEVEKTVSEKIKYKKILGWS
jgi:hypothetical protein